MLKLNKKGFYNVKLHNAHTLTAWYNPATGHWLNEDTTMEIGFTHRICGVRIFQAEFIGYEKEKICMNKGYAYAKSILEKDEKIIDLVKIEGVDADLIHDRLADAYVQGMSVGKIVESKDTITCSSCNKIIDKDSAYSMFDALICYDCAMSM